MCKRGIGHFHMKSQSIFHTEKLEKSLCLVFEIDSNKMIYNLNLFLYNNQQRTSVLAFKFNVINDRIQLHPCV